MSTTTKEPAMKIVDAAPLFEQQATEGSMQSRPVQPTDPLERPYKPDDDIIALALVPELTGTLAYFHNEWKEYVHGYWAKRESADVRRWIRKYLRDWRKYDVKVSQHKIKSLASMLEDDLYISDRAVMETFEEQRKYVNLRNGLFNLETMQLEDHRPELYFTTQLDFEYDEDAECPHFLKFLRSSLVLPGSDQPDNDLIMLVLEALGYSMTARTDQKASFWLVGQKDSGKSTFITMLKAIMGTLHGTIDLTQLGINRFLLAGLVGKRVVTFTEASGNTVLPDALYKTVTGGTDEVQADVKNRDPITFRPEAKIWWAMNEMPRFTDRSGATTRRIFIIPFNRTIPESQRIANLETLLWRERSGIFNKMVAYYRHFQKAGGFHYCAQSDDIRQQYITENDTEATYLEERAEQHESYKVQSSVLYADYKLWCEERGFHPKNYNGIAGEWRRLGFTSIKADAVFWKGLKLREKFK